MSKNIHPTAIVDPSADIHPKAVIEAYCNVGQEVKIGAGTVLKSQAQVLEYSTLGEGNLVSPNAIIGGAPQDLGYVDEPTQVVIGNNNVIREFVTINRGTTKQDGVTIIGDDNLFMAYSHLGHDCVVGDHCVFTNMSQVAGHCRIHDYVILSAAAMVHQFVTVGTRVFIAPNSIVRYDCLPGIIYDGNTAKPRVINKIGLQRAGYDTDALRHVKQAFKLLCRSKMTMEEAIEQIEQEPWAEEAFVAKMLTFAKNISGTHGSRTGNK